MPRQQRIHVSEGTYYVVRRTHSRQLIFSQPSDYALLESLLPAALRCSGARLLGYCWMPDAIHLALQVGPAPLGDFMRQFTSRYSYGVHRRTGRFGQLFHRRYQSTLIDPNVYLLRLIHYLHCIPVVAGLVQHPDEYAGSSHRAYLGSVHAPWLEIATVLRLLDSFDEDRATYRQFMAEPLSLQFRLLFERGHASVPGILGDADFIAGLPRRGRALRSKLSLDEITAYIARTRAVSVAELLSRSRRRDVVMGRAQIAWYATERRVASLQEVARHLHHSASSLTRAIARHQRRRPDLFTYDAFVALIPLVPVTRAEVPARRAVRARAECRQELPP